MNMFVKPALALGLAGAMALAVAAPSEARNGRTAAAIGAGVAGFAVGAAIGSAAASNRYYYYGEPYAYYPAYPAGYAYAPAYAYESYAYDPGPAYYVTPGVTRYNRRDPSSYYAPYYNSGWYNRERALTGSDW